MDSLYILRKGSLLETVPLSPFPLVLTLGFIAFLVYAVFFDPLRKVPGPFWARWSRLWMIYHARKGDMHAKMIALHKQYGKIVRTAPDEVSIDDPTAIKQIYGETAILCMSFPRLCNELMSTQGQVPSSARANGMVFGRVAVSSLVIHPLYRTNLIRRVRPFRGKERKDPFGAPASR